MKEQGEDDFIQNSLHDLTSTVKHLRDKVENEHLIITKADKGNTVVFMDRSDYRAKMKECFTTMGASIDPDFNFSLYNDTIRNAINTISTHLFDKEPIRKAILVSNPQTPCLYDLPKIHKNGSPMCRVVSYVSSSPPYKLAKYLDTWFKEVTNIQPLYPVKNSIEFCAARNQPPPAGCILISFDVVGFFPHIPLQPTCARMEDILREATVPPLLISDSLSLLESCLEPNICQYKQSVYKFLPDIGIPIGSPLGSVMSEVFMDMLE